MTDKKIIPTNLETMPAVEAEKDAVIEGTARKTATACGKHRKTAGAFTKH